MTRRSTIYNSGVHKFLFAKKSVSVRVVSQIVKKGNNILLLLIQRCLGLNNSVNRIQKEHTNKLQARGTRTVALKLEDRPPLYGNRHWF